jgi:hypothetical protein
LFWRAFNFMAFGAKFSPSYYRLLLLLLNSFSNLINFRLFPFFLFFFLFFCCCFFICFAFLYYFFGKNIFSFCIAS